ncbi:MAG: pantoate--beta-alanine ligase [Mariprofundaceae bacterium]
MIICKEPAELRIALANARDRNRVALVPTMGCLHAGHLSLVEKAKRLADIVVVSIYINPIQFSQHEDLSSYPRTLAHDIALCEDAGVDMLFTPENLYAAHGANITLSVHRMAQSLCGKSRPGHFNGVAMVVNILFNIIRPDIAIFGEKDFQQLTILRQMVSDLHMPVEVLGSETIRECDGLAMSSRNHYLDKEARKHASHIYRTLTMIYDAMNKGEYRCEKLIEVGSSYLNRYSGIQLEYLEIRHEYTLQNTDQLDKQISRAFIAAIVGGTRLIDNMILEVPA